MGGRSTSASRGSAPGAPAPIRPRQHAFAGRCSINAGLDAVYVAAGAHIAHHRSTLSGRIVPEAARGNGLAVVGQGLALMALDLTYARRLA